MQSRGIKRQRETKIGIERTCEEEQEIERKTQGDRVEEMKLEEENLNKRKKTRYKRYIIRKIKKEKGIKDNVSLKKSNLLVSQCML